MSFIERVKGKASKVNKHGIIGEAQIKAVPVRKPFAANLQDSPPSDQTKSKQSRDFSGPESSDGEKDDPISAQLQRELKKIELSAKIPIKKSSKLGEDTKGRYAQKGEVHKKEYILSGSKDQQELHINPKYDSVLADHLPSGSKHSLAQIDKSVAMKAVLQLQKPTFNPYQQPAPKRRPEKAQSDDFDPHANLKNAAYQYLSPAQHLLSHNSQASLGQHYKSIPSKKSSDSNVSHSRNPPNEIQVLPGMGARSTSLSEITPNKYRVYTLRDHEETKGQKYYMLGGLGADIGGKEWETRKEKLDRMSEFAKAVNLANRYTLLNNTSRPVLPGKHRLPEFEQAIQKKQKMLEYAKRVPKPKLAKIPEIEEGLQEMKARTEPLCELEKFEMEHNEFMERVAQFKHEIS